MVHIKTLSQLSHGELSTSCQRMTKRVAIINGIAKLRRYNVLLEAKYRQLGYEPTQYQFSKYKIFCCHMHPSLEPQAADIVESADVIHCQSSSFFPVLPYMHKHNIKKPLIMESPVLNSHTGTFYAAINRVKHYSEVDQNKLVNLFLDTVCFTPSWTKNIMNILDDFKKSDRALILATSLDGVSDIRGYEHNFHHIFDNGLHARLFDEGTTNDWTIVENYLKAYGEKQ